MADWNEIFREIQQTITSHNQEAQIATMHANGALDTIRRKYLYELFHKNGRNVIAYYSGWLSKPEVAQTEINDEDKNGFMMAVHGMDRKKGLNLILHTPGGSISATESIVDYLHRMFGDDIIAIVPQIAMSAGTMIACSCRKILMGRHSNLGPIDPHLRGWPAYGVREEFNRAIKEIKADPAKLAVWQPIIAQYRPTFLGQCENAIKWSDTFVRSQLESVMFKDDPKAKQKAKKIVDRLSDYRRNKSHERHIHFDECKAIGLEVELMEENQEYQNAVLSVHHCFMHTLMNTNAFKIIESHKGSTFVKQQVVQQVMVPQGQHR
jgi:ATP-dependent protease ClpP protease subunit